MKLRTRRSIVAAASALLLLFAAGCGGDDASGDTGNTDSDIKLGLAISTLNNPFFVQLRDGAQDAAKTANVDLSVTDAQNDASQQANQLQNFVTQGMSGVIINPVDSDAAGPMVTAVNNADIPVVAVDRGVNGAEVGAFIASDNVAGGKLAAEELAKQIGESGKVVVLQGIAGTSASRDRGAGFQEGIKAFPNIEVVATQPADFDRTKGLDVMTNLLQAHPDVKGVFAENDEMALGAIKALGSQAGAAVKVVGFDGTPDGLQAIKDGTLAASVAQLPKDLGRTAVEVLIKLVNGESVETNIMVPVTVITEDNVADAG